MSPSFSPLYGQAVVGPPGAGKTTYCDGMQQYLRLLGRSAWVVNLDPANERTSLSVNNKQHQLENTEATKNDNVDDDKLPYETLFDVCQEVINLTSVMEKTGLGPNGGLVYCMEYLESHIDEVLTRIRAKIDAINNNNSNDVYLLFDLPGQVELYTHSTCVHDLLHTIVKEWDVRLTAVQLIDAQYCTDATKFISAALLGTTTMIRLELPTINVLSKVDLLARYGELPLQFEYFTHCHDLDRLLPFVQGESAATADNDDYNAWQYVEDPDYQRAVQRRKESKLSRKHAKLHEVFAEVVQDFGLLSFLPLDITDAESVGRVLAKIDQSNGYVFVQDKKHTTNNKTAGLFQCAIQTDFAYDSIADIQERIENLYVKSESGTQNQKSNK